MEVIQDVYYRGDWRAKQAMAELVAQPSTIEGAVDIVLRAVLAEVERYNEYHAYDDGFVEVPAAALMMNATNRLPAALAEIVLSIGWLRCEGRQQKYELDENLQQSIDQKSPGCR